MQGVFQQGCWQIKTSEGVVASNTDNRMANLGGAPLCSGEASELKTDRQIGDRTAWA
jgi:hypothetical protein